MSQRVQGVIARAKGAPVEVTTIVVPDPGPGEAVVRDPGLRGLPHRPALPRGRHQRRLPVPARPRGGRHRRVGRRGRHRRGAGRLRGAELARRLRRLPGLPQWPAVVLLQHPQRHAEDDARGRHRAVAGAGHRRVRGEDAGARRAVHQGRPGRAAGRRRPARLRGDGRHRRGDQHRRRDPRRLGRGDRLRRRRRRRDRRVRRWPARPRSSRSTPTTRSSSGRAGSARPTRSTPGVRTWSRRCRR